jgi:predicted MFS family arabinose efflux permease
MIAGLVMLPLVGESYFIPFELIGLALIALANGCLTPSITSMISKYSDPKEVGQILGVNQSFGSLARAAGMGVSGFLYGMNFHIPFFVGALLMLSCFLLANAFSKTPPPANHS